MAALPASSRHRPWGWARRRCCGSGVTLTLGSCGVERGENLGGDVERRRLRKGRVRVEREIGVTRVHHLA